MHSKIIKGTSTFPFILRYCDGHFEISPCDVLCDWFVMPSGLFEIEFGGILAAMSRVINHTYQIEWRRSFVCSGQSYSDCGVSPKLVISAFRYEQYESMCYCSWVEQRITPRVGVAEIGRRHPNTREMTIQVFRDFCATKIGVDEGNRLLDDDLMVVQNIATSEGKTTMKPSIYLLSSWVCLTYCELAIIPRCRISWLMTPPIWCEVSRTRLCT